jgi:hypothetical protein
MAAVIPVVMGHAGIEICRLTLGGHETAYTMHRCAFILR